MKNTFLQSIDDMPYLRIIFSVFLFVCCFSVGQCCSVLLPPCYGMLIEYINESQTLSSAVSKITTDALSLSYHRSSYPTRELLARSVMRFMTPEQAIEHRRRFNLKPTYENTPSMRFDERWLYTAIMLRSMRVDAGNKMLRLVNLNDSIIPDQYKERLLLETYGDWDSVVAVIENMAIKGYLRAFDMDVQDYLLVLHKKKCKTKKKKSNCGCCIL